MLVKTKNYLKRHFSEFIFSFYFILYNLIRPITLEVGTIFLFLVALVYIGIVIANQKTNKASGNYRAVVYISAIVLSFISCDVISRYNENIFEYVYSYIIYAGIPLVAFSYIHDYKAVLIFFSYITILNGAIYMLDPFRGYPISGGYMPFGFQYMLPAFTGACILRFFFNKKFATLLIISFFTLSFLFANKGATLVEIIVLAYCFAFYKRQSSFKRIIIIILSASIIFIFRQELLIFGFNLLGHFGFESSYSLATLDTIVNGDGQEVYNLRTEIWRKTVALSKQHIYNGWGIGWFEEIIPEREYPYPHNVFLQILFERGIIVLVLFICFLGLGVLKIITIKDRNKKGFMCLMGILGMCPLLVSLTYWQTTSFWIFIALIISQATKINYKNYNKNITANSNKISPITTH